MLALAGLPAELASTLELTDTLDGLLSRRAGQLAWRDSTAAGDQQPAVLREKLAADLAAASQRVAGQRSRPTVRLVGYLGTNGYADRFAQTLARTPNWYGNAYAAVQAHLPLLDGAARATRVESQRLRQQQARNRQTEVQLMLRYETSHAYDALQQAWELLWVEYENGVAASDQAHQARQGPRTGPAAARETWAAAAAQRHAEAAFTQATYDFLVAHLDYDRLTGKLPE